MRLFFLLTLSFIAHTAFAINDSIHTQIQDLLDKTNTPGAVVVWVQNGEPVILKGYGYANLEEKKSIDVESTLFRIGSISKPFTAMGVLQQVEKGRINLDADINTYFEKPIIRDHFQVAPTMRHLLTHTIGFDDRYVGLASPTLEKSSTLKQCIEKYLPARVVPSGSFFSYSNFGVGLAGYILEHVVEKEFSSYMYDNVFLPLGMQNTTFFPEGNQLKKLATGYYNLNNSLTPLAFDYITLPPAGSVVSTACDMAHFIPTILEVSNLASKGILSQQSATEMLAVQFKNHPDLKNGTGYLWALGEFNGHQYFGHDGAWNGAHASLMLFPEHNAGFFIAMNTSTSSFIGEVASLLVKTYLPEPPTSSSSVSAVTRFSDDRPLTDFAGTWRPTRYTKNLITKVATLIRFTGGEFRTSLEGDSVLTMPDHNGETRRLVRVAPLLFQSLDDDYKMAFREENGKITHVFTDGINALEKLHPLETSMVQLSILGGSLLLFGALTIIYLLVFLIRRSKQKPVFKAPYAPFEWAVAGVYFMGFIMMVIVLSMTPFHEIMVGFAYGVPKGLYVANSIPYFGLFLTLALVYKVFTTKISSIIRLSWSILFIAVSLAYFFSMNYWNLVGWKF
jgi:CubicO group peptidase (beta-lactamase class C family)